MVVWDGPLVGTPDGWRGGAGWMGCNGRDIGWEELMVDTEVWFIFLGSVNEKWDNMIIDRKKLEIQVHPCHSVTFTPKRTISLYFN